MGGKSRGELEAEFTRAVIKFEKDYLGRGPLEARTFFVSDMILIRVRGVLTRRNKPWRATVKGSAWSKKPAGSCSRRPGRSPVRGDWCRIGRLHFHLRVAKRGIVVQRTGAVQRQDGCGAGLYG
jgi:hypothetical protein